MNNMQKSFKQKAAMGIRAGMVHGKGTTTSDSVPVHLSRGEEVLPAETVQAVGAGNVANLIKRTTGHAPKGIRAGGHYAEGGVWDSMQAGAKNLYGAAKTGLGGAVDSAKAMYAGATAPAPAPVNPVAGSQPMSNSKWDAYNEPTIQRNAAASVPPEAVAQDPLRITAPKAPPLGTAASNLGGTVAEAAHPTVAGVAQKFGLGGKLGGLAATGLEGYNASADIATPGMTGADQLGRGFEAGSRLAGGAAGSTLGARYGATLAGGKGAIVGGLLGGAAGALAPEYMLKAAGAATGVPVTLPSDTAKGLRTADVALMQGIPDELALGAKNQEAMAAWNAKDAAAAKAQADSPEGKAAAAGAQLRTNQDAWLQRQGVTSAQLGGAPTTQNASNLKNQTQSGIRQDSGPAPLTTPDGIIGRRFNAEDVQAINARRGIREAQQTLAPQLLQNADTESTDRIMGSSNRADKKMNVFTGVGGGANWEDRHPAQYKAALARQPNPSQQAAQDDMDETMAAYTAYHPKAGLALQLENRRNMLQGQSNMLQHQQMALTERHATEDRKLGIAAGTRAHDQDYQMHMATLGNTMGQQNLEQHEKAFASAFGKPKDGETDAAQPVRQALANDLASQGIPAGAMTGADVQRYIQDYKAQQAREPGSLRKIQLYLRGEPYTESASVLDKQAVAGGRSRGSLGLSGQTNRLGDFTYDPARITKDAQEEANYKSFGGGR